jgi:steroid delta-isomerase-like uncharacterized protein
VSAAENKALVDRYIQEIWVERNPEAIARFVAPDYKRHMAPGAPALDLESQIERIKGFGAAFPDITVVVDDIIADDHGASFRATLNGTQLGDFAGIPATGRAIEVHLVDFMEIKDGKIVAQWGGPDMRDMLQQLGATLTMDG